MPCILAVDDDQNIRELLAEILRKEGFEVHTAEDGEVALQMLQSNPLIDLVVLDIIMPNKEGLETIRDIRNDFPDVKIIAITGGGVNSPDTYLKGARMLGAHATLAKPFPLKVFHKTVKSLIQMKTEAEFKP